MNDGVMTYEDWLRSRVYYDGKDGFVTLLCEDVLEIADCIERLKESNANQRIQDVKNNYTPQTDCNPTCEFYDEQCLSVDCYGCCDGYSRYKLKDEPQLVKESTEVVKDLVKDTPQTDCGWGEPNE